MGLAAAGAVAGIAGGVAGVASAAGNLLGAGKGAQGQSQSAYLQALQYNQNIAQQTPFINAGQYGATTLQNQLMSGQLGTPMDLSGQPTVANMPTPPPQFSWNPTMAGLAATPGYQFNLQQQLQAQQNSATARGLGVSGAQLRGAADYASGLAGTTYNQQLQNAINTNQQQLLGYGQQLAGFTAGQGAYQNQFNDYWANQTNRVSQLQNLGTMGENAAAGQGYSGTVGAQGVGNAVANAGAIQGSGIAGATNALAGTLNSPQVQTNLTNGLNYLFGTGGSTISPQTVVNNANYENQQFAQNPPGTYGPFQ